MYATVIKPMSYKVLFALATFYDLHIEQMDVITAFLHRELSKVIYMVQPLGFEDEDWAKVCQLNKALYGLKQSSRVWYQTLYEFLSKHRFYKMNADYSVFLGQGGIIVAVYVDDLLLFGLKIAPIEALKRELSKAFDMKDLGPCTYYLGMHIT